VTDRFLMCAPDHFEVAYVINPWMEGNIARGNNDVATRQWKALARLIGNVARVERVTAAPGVPDMVFTANAGLVLEDKFVLSRFRHEQRQAEEPHFAKWFAEQGFDVLTLPHDIPFEGAGDALLDRREPLLWLGYGHRSEQACAPLLADWLDLEVEPLKLVNERFYHLDTCFCPLEGGYLMYYPAAFDQASQARIAARVPAKFRIPVADADAFDFACNAVNCGQNIFLNHASGILTGKLRLRGFAVHQTPLTEFMKAGGSAKCLTLKLTESRIPAIQAAA
jgi:N-dimethylarginine dimethylaminohydrolase